MNIFILPIEPIESRYSAEWHKHIPLQLRKYATKVRCRKDVVVKTISGTRVPNVVPPGQFLDFAATNIYKSSQIVALAKIIQAGGVRDVDQILITDAWNPGVLQIRYMLDLMGIKARIHGLWHAGSYDKTDILGMSIRDKTWSYATERAMFFAYHQNYFASAYHVKVFADVLGIKRNELRYASRVVGWPMEYLDEAPRGTTPRPKEKLIVFPHRLSQDKQVDLARDLAVRIKQQTDYEMVFTQDSKLSKVEYHDLLERAQFVFSMSLHEMLGIGMYEGALHGAIPLMPSRLSYVEMYGSKFLYPSAWTNGEVAYQKNVDSLIKFIQDAITNRLKLEAQLDKELPHITSKFFDGYELYENLFRS